ncbi:hypothetical protein [Chryseobacterium salviniae]|uniref:Uncharacterized protein n=1 Tax=Chryseobacterium salviniae TaxID=3101750 RepID=A0ABU6HVX2_9FLAO|nr:hypothetical protein [Chryseobacterium sp. T9W2-O]MEC3877191.1 hypothetical protein [Chryseobacterium sp. T9W2-O]
MKKILFIFIFIIIPYQTLFCQIAIGVNAQTFFETLYFKNNKYEYKDVKGTPYLNPNFQIADIGSYKDIPTRYNSYTDSFEFKKDDLIYIVPKEDNLSKIFFKTTGKTFILTTLDNAKVYLEQVSSNPLVLKKITTIFKDLKKASSSYEQDVPPSFENIPPKYYVSKDGKLFELSKKSVSSNFSEKEKSLKSFMKQNNLSFDEESDLAKIADFLSK